MSVVTYIILVQIKIMKFIMKIIFYQNLFEELFPILQK